MEQDVIKRFLNIAPLISNTPLLKIQFRFRGEKRCIYAKAEYYNISGSIKDRVALDILKKAYERGTIHKGDTILEATSGNTGISFSALGSYLNHPVEIFMPDWMSKERIDLIKSYGAKVNLISKEEGGFLGAIKKAEILGQKPGVFLPKQFSNEDNVTAHNEITGEEIINQMATLNLIPDGVVAGVGTGGTIMGLNRSFKKINPACKAFPLEPLNSPTLSTGYKTGQHRIYGISDDFVPSIVKLQELDSIVSVDDSDAILMARMLSEKLGIGVGVSSGANFLGSVMAQNMLGPESIIVTVFADDNKKYLSTDYTKPQEMKENHLSNDIELFDVIAYR